MINPHSNLNQILWGYLKVLEVLMQKWQSHVSFFKFSCKTEQIQTP